MEKEEHGMKISFHVIKRRTLYIALACALVLASIALLVFKGFNLGIDFESGLSISVKIEDSGVDIAEVRSAVSSIEGVRVQNVGASDDGRYQIRVKLPNGTTQRDAENRINALLSSGFKSFSMLESSYIGAKFSSSLITGSIKAVAIALALILVYVWIRFKVAYAIGSIIALMHDVLLMLGFISLVGFEISSTTIAAILTIIGYSLNNTIVIFDRVRETTRLAPKVGKINLDFYVEEAVNDTFTRSAVSTITTMIPVFLLGCFGVLSLKQFAWPIMFGLIAGTYSSLILAPTVYYLIRNAVMNGKLKKGQQLQKKSDASDLLSQRKRKA